MGYCSSTSKLSFSATVLWCLLTAYVTQWGVVLPTTPWTCSLFQLQRNNWSTFLIHFILKIPLAQSYSYMIAYLCTIPSWSPHDWVSMEQMYIPIEIPQFGWGLREKVMSYILSDINKFKKMKHLVPNCSIIHLDFLIVLKNRWSSKWL